VDYDGKPIRARKWRFVELSLKSGSGGRLGIWQIYAADWTAQTMPHAVTSTSFLRVDFAAIFTTTMLTGLRPATIDLSKRWSAVQVHRLVLRASMPCDTHFGEGARNLNGSLFSKLADWSPTTSGLPARVNFRTPVPSLKSILSSFTHRAPGLLVSW
jgi:hypothetical protein